MRPLALLLLVACAARAQDALVERFETELRALVRSIDAAARDAVVTVADHPGASAILAGTPPRVVAPYSTVGEADRVRVRLADGREVAAVRWGGDADLGVVVFKLPDDIAKDLKGVDVEGDWSRLGAGSVAVATDGRGRGGGKVGLVAAAEPHLGTIDAPGDGAAVFGSRGTLIGLRGGADMTSCAACHQTASWAGLPSYNATARGEALTRFVLQKQGELPKGGGKVDTWLREWLRDPHSAQYGKAGSAPATDHLVAGPVIRRVLDDFEKHGEIRHAFLGVVVGDIAGEQAVQIATVVPDSPAAAAGLAPGARIDAIDGLSCPSASFFSRVLVLHRPGDEVTLTTGGREIKVRLGERSAARASVAGIETVGLSCVDLGDELRRFLGFPAELRGVVVQEVTPGSPAAEAGIRRGDVITGGGGGVIADLEELGAALASARGRIELSGVRRIDGSSHSTAWTSALEVPAPKGY